MFLRPLISIHSVVQYFYLYNKRKLIIQENPLLRHNCLCLRDHAGPPRELTAAPAPGEGGGQSWAPLHVEQLGSFLRRPSVHIPGPPPRCPRPPHGASCGSAGLPDGSSLTHSSPGLRKKSSDWGQSPREVAEPPLPHPCSRTFCPGSRSGGGQEVGALGVPGHSGLRRRLGGPRPSRVQLEGLGRGEESHGLPASLVCVPGQKVGASDGQGVAQSPVACPSRPCRVNFVTWSVLLPPCLSRFPRW